MRGLFILLLLASCGSDETVSAYATHFEYTLTKIDEADAPYHATIGFRPNGKIVGQSPCNNYAAQSLVPYPWLEIRQIVGTKKACPDLKSEIEFLSRLPIMTLAEFSGPLLILSTDNGHSMTFEAQD